VRAGAEVRTDADRSNNNHRSGASRVPPACQWNTDNEKEDDSERPHRFATKYSAVKRDLLPRTGGRHP
jgi:hypothetical protein